MAGWLAVLMLPLCVVAINTSWLMTLPGAIDPWVYFGYFSNLRLYLDVFAGTYYGTRLAWIVPGALAHGLLPLMAANYVLHLGVYYTAIVALYFTLTRVAGRRAALIAAIFAGCYSYLLYAVGWDYVDGAGLAYYSVAIAGLTAAFDARRRWLALVCAGAGFAASFHTNVVWGCMLPAFGYYYIVTTRGRGHVFRDSLFVIAGAVLVTFALGIVSVAHGGQWLFFMPSIRIASALLSGNTYKAGLATRWFLALWLLFPAVVLVSTVYFVIARRAGETRLGRLAAEHYLLMCLIFVVFDLTGGALLQYPFYVSYLIPGMALAAGVQMRAALNPLSRARYVAILGIAFAAFALTFLSPVALRLFKLAYYPLADYGSHRLFVVPLVLMLVALMLLRAWTNMFTLATFLLCAGVANVLTVDGGVWDFRGTPLRTNTFRATVAASRVMAMENPRMSARSWYDEGAPLGPVFTSIASTRLWGFRLVGTRFPSLGSPTAGKDALVEAGQDLVILTGEEGALTQADAALRERGLHATLIARHDIAEGDIRVTLLFVHTTLDRRLLADVRLPVTTDVFLGGSVKVNAERVVFDAGSGPLHITTNRSMFDFQIMSRPILVTPARRHLAEFELGIPTGGGGFHVVASKTQEVLASRYWCEGAMTPVHAEVMFDPGPNDSVRFVVSNCGTAPIVSDITVKDIQVWPYR